MNYRHIRQIRHYFHKLFLYARIEKEWELLSEVSEVSAIAESLTGRMAATDRETRTWPTLSARNG